MDNEYNDIDVQINNKIATIWLNRAEKRNALSLTMIAEIVQAVTQIQEIAEVQLIVIRSALTDPVVFSAGIDLTDLADQATSLSPEGLTDLVEKMQDNFSQIRDCTLPTIAVIDGLCVGAGLELAIACDFRLVSHQSSLALNETQFGLVPDLGGTTHLVRMVGSQVAKRMIMLAEMLDSERAFQVGLVDWVSEKISSKLDEITSQLLGNSQQAVQQAKKLVNSSLDFPVSESLSRDGKAQFQLIASGVPMKRLGDYLGK